MKTLFLAILAFAGGSLRLAAQADDIVIRNGRVIDGSGSPAILGDVAIRGDRIAAIGKIAAAGRIEIVAAGFIDGHTHSENITSAWRRRR